MSGYRIGEHALRHLEEIYLHTIDHWGPEAADEYARSLFTVFDRIAANDIVSRAIEAEFGIDGHCARCASHLVYWRRARDGMIEILAILHRRMHQPERLRQLLSD